MLPPSARSCGKDWFPARLNESVECVARHLEGFGERFRRGDQAAMKGRRDDEAALIGILNLQRHFSLADRISLRHLVLCMEPSVASTPPTPDPPPAKPLTNHQSTPSRPDVRKLDPTPPPPPSPAPSAPTGPPGPRPGR